VIALASDHVSRLLVADNIMEPTAFLLSNLQRVKNIWLPSDVSEAAPSSSMVLIRLSPSIGTGFSHRWRWILKLARNRSPLRWPVMALFFFPLLPSRVEENRMLSQVLK
jgi:hypothetical protein